MHKALIPILEIQELDMQMIQLMRLKQERVKELENLRSVKKDLQGRKDLKNEEIHDLKIQQRMLEGEVKDLTEKYKKLESQQSSVKKVDEFNALSKEMAQVEKERNLREQQLSDLLDTIVQEEDVLKTIDESLETTTTSSEVLESEILDSIKNINNEGQEIKQKRDKIVETADPDTFRIYERLLLNKQDRVVVPIENRCCSGCHIMVTAQDENLVRKGERLIFCEHCSRIHYWPESEQLDESAVTPKKRRRRATAAS